MTKGTNWKLIYYPSSFGTKPEGFYFRNEGDPHTKIPVPNEKIWGEIRQLRHDLEQARFALIAIKTGIINVPPKKSSRDWTEKKIKTLEETQQYVTRFLNGETEAE